MSIFIHDIATSVPDAHSQQQHIREVMKKHVGNDRKTRAIIHRIYTQSGIDKRHSVVEDFSPNDRGTLFFNGQAKSEPGTGARNEVYQTEAKKLFVDVASKLLKNNSNIKPQDVTHVITVSCTGFFAPGPDFEIVKALDLKPTTQRFHVGFMGCYAVFPALKMAQSFCTADPNAVVLIVSAELCTLHFQFKNNIDNLLSGSVFADGAGGMIVSSKKASGKHLKIRDFASSLTTKGEKDMAWTIGDSGFNMILSTYVPDIIKDNLESVIQPLYDQLNFSKDEVDYWAIHPGGRSILDKIQKAMQLSPEQIAAPRKVLADFGNMSSSTIMFVLKEIFESKEVRDKQNILAMAFGPGLTIESGLLTFHNQ